MNGDPTEPLSIGEIVDAAIVGLGSIHHPGRWVDQFLAELPMPPTEESVRAAGSSLLRTAIELSVTNQTDRAAFHGIAARNWRSVDALGFEDVVQRASVSLLRVVNRYEQAAGRFAPGPDQVPFPVRSSFKQWTNAWLRDAAIKQREFHESHVTGSQDDLSSEAGPSGPLPSHEDLVRSRVQLPETPSVSALDLSPDVRAITYRAADQQGEQLALLVQTWRIWLLRGQEHDFEPRATVRLALKEANPHLDEDAISKRMDRQAANVAYGMRSILERPANRRRLSEFLLVATVGWRLLEFRGVTQLISEAAKDAKLAPLRRTARLAWLIEVTDWLTESDDHGFENSHRRMTPAVADARDRLHVLTRDASAEVAPAIDYSIIRLQRWLDKEST